MSKTHRGYAHTGNYFKKKDGSVYEKVMVGDYDLICTYWREMSFSDCYYQEQSKEKTIEYVKLKKWEAEDLRDFKSYISSDTEESKAGPWVGKIESQDIVAKDRVDHYQFTEISRTQSMAGKILKPLVFIDTLVVDVPLSAIGIFGVLVYHVGEKMITRTFGTESSPEKVAEKVEPRAEKSSAVP